MTRELAPSPPSRKRKLIWVILLAGLALVILLALAAFFRRSGLW